MAMPLRTSTHLATQDTKASVDFTLVLHKLPKGPKSCINFCKAHYYMLHTQNHAEPEVTSSGVIFILASNQNLMYIQSCTVRAIVPSCLKETCTVCGSVDCILCMEATAAIHCRWRRFTRCKGANLLTVSPTVFEIVVPT